MVKQTSTHPLWRLLKLTAPFAGRMALAALLGFATVGSSIGLMATSAYIIARAALHPSIVDLQIAIVGVRFFGISRGLFRYLERYVSHQVTFHLLARLRVWFYEALEPLAPARLQQYHSGDLLSRIVADIESLEHFYVRVIAPPAVALLSALLTGLLLASFDFRLALVILFFLALAGLGVPWLARRLSRGLGQEVIRLRAELNTLLIDTLQGMADLLAAGQAGRATERVRQLSRALAGRQGQLAWRTGLQDALTGLLLNLATLAALWLAIPLVGGGRLDGVDLAVLVLAVMASFEAVSALPAAFQHLESSQAAAERLFEIVDAGEAISPTPSDLTPRPPSLQGKGERGGEVSLPPLIGERVGGRGYSLTVNNLHFRYAPNEPEALAGLSFSLPEGGRLAVVGPSGAGKSTLAALLLRFWEYQAGSIELGGIDLRRYSPEEVRRLIGVVSQGTHLFNTTIRENLLLARPEASEAEMIEAARQARIHNFIQALPEGYNTWVGEQGVRLSGGERQRLAIARALLKDAPLLLLDEPTANLDALTEREVLQSLVSLMAGRTSLLITHRLVGLEAMDDILVLRAGQVVERGRADELWQSGGLYRRLWELQQDRAPFEA